MFRVSDLIDLPVIALREGTTLKYCIKSLLLDGFNNKIAAFVCKESAMKKNCRFILYEKIISIDVNGIIIPEEKCIVKASMKELRNYLPIEDIMNKCIKSSTGELHGVLTDVYVNLLNGKITGYELSEGYIDDFFKGRKIIDIHEALGNAFINNEIILYQKLQ